MAAFGAMLFFVWRWLGKRCCGRRFNCRNVSCCRSCLRKVGYDEFEEFTLMFTVHYVQGILDKDLYVLVNAGWKEIVYPKSDNGNIEKTEIFDVPQGGSELEIEVRSAGLMSDKVIGSCMMNMYEHIVKGVPVTNKEFCLLNEQGMKVGVVSVSWMKTDSPNASMPRVLQDLETPLSDRLARAHMITVAKKFGKNPWVTKYDVFMKALEGPLRLTRSWGNQLDVNLRLRQNAKGKWEIAWWEEGVKFSEEPSGSIKIYNIVKVIQHPDTKFSFLIIFRNAMQTREAAEFERIDRDRDIWVSCLHVVVSELRFDRSKRRAEIEEV